MSDEKEWTQEEFWEAVEKLEKQIEEAFSSAKGEKPKTKVIEDKNGRQRVVKVSEDRKTLCVYIPESLYEQFDFITEKTRRSKNSTIVELISNYVIEQNGVLE